MYPHEREWSEAIQALEDPTLRIEAALDKARFDASYISMMKAKERYEMTRATVIGFAIMLAIWAVIIPIILVVAGR